ncbi:hypothetical protein STCU_07369 [Strigomonas culicis]|uniref:Rieske domain-containing protein n=1 Tax=Strigomonas culicis TaxID=28005 RepID=S9U4W5_9TRYP|nr:hypothetical protein STCU_07369 [Strigomonas culicis]|eukprot:EPY23983.1 hypothetical protein STCU_07369 [Strigomonas culicis]
MPSYEYDGWSVERFLAQRSRAHFLLEDPYHFVTVILHQHTERTRQRQQQQQPLRGYTLYCLDSPCYHASGPLGEGRVVEMEDFTCIECPWHRYLIDLDTGRLVELEVDEQRYNTMQQASAASAAPAAPLPPGMTPLTPLPCDHPAVTAARGSTVLQRIHEAALDEATGILTITVADEGVVRRRPVRSDGAARSMQYGGVCMQIADIKAKGFDT